MRRQVGNLSYDYEKALLIAAKVLIVALVAWFVRGTLISTWDELRSQPLQLRMLRPAWLVFSGVIYLVALLPAGWYWHHILKTLGQEAGLGESLQAYYLGHLGKYVPGKAMVIILRTGLIRSHRVDTTLAVVSVFYETLTMMAVGSFLAGGILAFRLREERLLLWASLGFMLLAGLPTLPPIFRLILRVMQLGKFQKASQTREGETPAEPRSGDTASPARAARQEPRPPDKTVPTFQAPSPKPQNQTPILESAAKLGYRTVFIGWFAMLLVWAGMAASLWAVFQGCGLDYPLGEHFADFTAAVSLSVVGGFLTLIPAGLAVREMISIALLVPLFHIGDAQAAVVSGLLRLVWLFAELAAFAVLYPLRMKFRRAEETQDPRPKSKVQSPAQAASPPRGRGG